MTKITFYLKSRGYLVSMQPESGQAERQDTHLEEASVLTRVSQFSLLTELGHVFNTWRDGTPYSEKQDASLSATWPHTLLPQFWNAGTPATLVLRQGVWERCLRWRESEGSRLVDTRSSSGGPKRWAQICIFPVRNAMTGLILDNFTLHMCPRIFLTAWFMPNYTCS